MKNYLSGYLDILPQGQENKVRDVLRATKDSVDAGYITEAEFKELARRIAEEHEQLTKLIPQVEKVDSELHNAFFSKVSTDINLMYRETQLVERALSSYERLYDGILADLSKEVKALGEKINSLRLIAEGENGLIVKSVDFSDNNETETDRERYSHLFTDRDGSMIPDAIIQRAGEVSYLSLKELSGKDRLRDEKGNVVADMQIVDYRGVPVPQTIHPIEHALDASSDSYWGEVVLSDEPLRIGIDDVATGGALVKFTITFPRQEVISEIRLDPFTHFPLEIASITYEEDTETFHIPKQLVKAKTESTAAMVLQFPSIIARRLTFVLKQSNYVENTYTILEREATKAELWEMITKREVEITLEPTSPNATVTQEELNAFSGWDIYLIAQAKYEEEYPKYIAALTEYQAKKAKWDQEVATYRTNYSNYINQINSINRSYGLNYTTEPSAI